MFAGQAPLTGPPRSEARNNADSEACENVGNYYDSWESVEADLRGLDGDGSDSMFIAFDRRDNMSIAGGNESRYLVQALIGDVCFVCSSGGNDASIKDVVACGDLVPCPSTNVVDLETALVAAAEFYRTGSLFTRLKWDFCR